MREAEGSLSIHYMEIYKSFNIIFFLKKIITHDSFNK